MLNSDQSIRNLSVYEGVTNDVRPATSRSNITYFTRFYRRREPSLHDFLSTSDTLSIHYEGEYCPSYFGIRLTLTAVKGTQQRTYVVVMTRYVCLLFGAQFLMLIAYNSVPCDDDMYQNVNDCAAHWRIVNLNLFPPHYMRILYFSSSCQHYIYHFEYHLSLSWHRLHICVCTVFCTVYVYCVTVCTCTERDSDGSCGHLYFTCASTHLCIAEELQCNGQYNCGLYDDSDEENCARLPDHTDYNQNMREYCC